jgi:large subunit ribosomal protein L17e
MKIHKAIRYLEQVLEHKQIIPFRKYTGGIGRSAQTKVHKHTEGRWPEKSTKQVHLLLKNLLNNCETKGLNTERCHITHVVVQRAVAGRRRTYRAHGRMTPYLAQNCHVEFHATEKAEGVQREEKAQVRLTKKQAARQRLAIGK